MEIAGILIVCIVSAAVYAGINVLNRRWDAVIVSREDYDEDVDGKMTKKEREVFEARKVSEADKVRMPLKEVFKERPKRFVLVLIWGILLSGLAAWYFSKNGFIVSDSGKTVNVAIGTAFLLLLYAIYTLEALIDLDTCEIPAELNIAIAVLGILSIFLWPHVMIAQRIIGAACIAVPMILLDLVIPGAFGGGDIKLLAASGFLLGWKILVAGFFIGAVIQAVIAIIFVILKKKDWKSHLPFGPMLCLGLIISTMAGTQLINWYINIIMMSMGRA